jgi:hypothetical protein
VVHFEEAEVVKGEREGEEGEEGEKMERGEKQNTGVEKGKWGNRGLSGLVLGQNGKGS